MVRYYGCDAHKRYSVFNWVDESGHRGHPVRVEHDRILFRSYVESLPAGTPIAVETLGNWYWLIEEMEKAGHDPHLTHEGKAKLMMGQINKTDKLDATGLAVLLRNGTLPRVWIPPEGLRDKRELPRMRMMLVGMRTQLKNRIHATRLEELPPYTRVSAEMELKLLDQVGEQIESCEKQIAEVVETTPEMKLLMTLPGVGMILTVVIALEIGDVERFGSGERLASYAGTVPRIISSGGKTRHGKTRADVNRYLKWAFVEAANVIVRSRARHPDSHVVRLYVRIRERKGHAKAAVAVARHLAEAAYWVLKKKESYRDPQFPDSTSSTRKETRTTHEN
jgi:transposase